MSQNLVREPLADGLHDDGGANLQSVEWCRAGAMSAALVVAVSDPLACVDLSMPEGLIGGRAANASTASSSFTPDTRPKLRNAPRASHSPPYPLIRQSNRDHADQIGVRQASNDQPGRVIQSLIILSRL